MSTPKDNESKLQTEELNNPPNLGVQQDSFGEATSLESIKNTNDSQVNTKEEKAKWEKEIDRFYRAYEFHLEFVLKAVGFFYAILGGILSISFIGNGKMSKEIVIVLLGFPILMGIILGSIFLYGDWVWRKDIKFIRKKVEEFGIIEIWLKVEILSYALRIFGPLFFIVGIFLFWLITRLDLK
ncbi:MAG TPA: hypothetical protein VF648_00330 [Pyrinomonadaceae bacterium]